MNKCGLSSDVKLVSIVLIALFLSLGSGLSWASQSSQYHRSKYTTQQQTDSSTTSNTANAIDLFSDTTSNADTSSVAVSPMGVNVGTPINDSVDNFDRFMTALMAHGVVVGVIFGIIGIVFALVLCALPFLVIILPIVYLIKRSNNKTRITEKMIEQGAPLPDLGRDYTIGGEALMQRGIRQSAIGVGLMILFAFMDADVLIGVGGLVTAIGVGKIISARVTMRRTTNTSDSTPDANKEADHASEDQSSLS